MAQTDSVCRALVSQLLLEDKPSGRIRAIVAESYDSRRDLEFATEDQVWSLLFAICKTEPIDLVLDAFDEISDQKMLLSYILSLGAAVRVTIFSRIKPMSGLDSIVSQSITISRNDVEPDIDIMIRASLVSSDIFLASQDKQTLEYVRARVLERAAGVFIWARLAVDGLDQLQTVGEVAEHIDSCPESISVMYKEALRRLSQFPPKQHERALRLLGWVASSRRALSLGELEDALVLTPSTVQIADKDRIISIRSVISKCHPLIEIDTETSEVRVCHYSVKEFIMGLSPSEALKAGFTPRSSTTLGSELSKSNGILCLQYLNMESLRRDWADDASQALMAKTYPLFEYAVCYWLDHLLDGSPDILSLGKLRDFLAGQGAGMWLKEFITFQQHTLGHSHYGSVIMALERRLANWERSALSAADVPERSSIMSNVLFHALLEQRVLQQAKLFGSRDLATLEAYRALYMHYSWRGRLEEAEKVLQNILATFGDSMHPPGNKLQPALIDVLFYLSQINVSKGNIREAFEICARVYDARKKAFGEDSFETAEAAGGLADILTDMNKLDEAEKMHRFALCGLLNTRGEQALDTAFQYNNFGNCLCQLGKLQEAQECLTKALRSRQAVLGANSSSALRTLDCLGVVYLRKNDAHAAHRAHTTAFGGMKEIVGDRHFFTWRAACNLAAAEAELGNILEARQLALQALLNLEAILGPAALDTLTAADVVSGLHGGEHEDFSIAVRHIASERAATSLGSTHALTKKLQAGLPTATQKTRFPSRVFKRALKDKTNRYLLLPSITTHITSFAGMSLTSHQAFSASC